MPRDFKSFLKGLRLHAGYGLRQFAELIGEHPSNYSGVESGQRSPPRTVEKLRRIADALALKEGSSDWDTFFILARENTGLPPDMEHLLERPMIPVLLRTVDELRLTDDELKKFIDDLRRKKAKER